MQKSSYYDERLQVFNNSLKTISVEFNYAHPETTLGSKSGLENIDANHRTASAGKLFTSFGVDHGKEH